MGGIVFVKEKIKSKKFGLFFIFGLVTMVFYQNCGPFKSNLASETMNANSTSQLVIDGKLLYESRCIQCHGELKTSLLRNKLREEILLALDNIPEMSTLSDLKTKPYPVDAIAAYLQSPLNCNQRSNVWMAPRLTREQYAYSIYDLLGISINKDLLPVDGRRGAAANNLFINVNEGLLDKYFSVLEDSTSNLISAFKRKFNCPSLSQTCVKMGLETLGQKAFRSSLTDSLKTALFENYSNSLSLGSSGDEALYDALSFIFLSPRFLFPFEKDRSLGQKMTSYEIAARLALLLWSSVPDDQLLTAAGLDQLRTEAEINAQIQRMLADSKADRLQDSFLHSWLGLDAYMEQNVVTGSIDDSYQKETIYFLRDALQNNRSPSYVFTADSSFIDQTLASHYGISGSFNTTPQATSIQSTLRRGILGQGSFLTTVASPNFSTVFKRGNHVLKHFLCSPPPPPPANIQATTDPNDLANLNDAELALQHRQKGSACYTCHSRIDPVGLSLSMFDDKALLKSNFSSYQQDLVTLPDGTVVDSPIKLSQYLSQGNRSQNCFVIELSRYVFSGFPEEEVACLKEDYQGDITSGERSLKYWISTLLKDSVAK